MKTKKIVVRSETRLAARKEQSKPGMLRAKTGLCYNCGKNHISPYEVDLCDFCADEIRFTPRIM